MRKTICAARAGPVVRNENRVGTDGLNDHGANRDVVASRRYGDPIAVFYAVLVGEARVEFCTRFGILIDQGSNAARLRTGQILADDSSSSQV